MAISLTEAAAAQICRNIDKRGGGLGVRLAVKPSGCSGFMYSIDEVETPASSDIRITLENGVIICFDPRDAISLRGIEIDYTRQGLNQTVKISNPNVADTCGCGASFTLNIEEPRQ